MRMLTFLDDRGRRAEFVDQHAHPDNDDVRVGRHRLHQPPRSLWEEGPDGRRNSFGARCLGRVLEEAAAGKTLFISSHMLSEVEIICDRVGIIREGSLVAIEEIATLRERALTRVEIEFADSVSVDDFRGLDGVRDVVVSDRRLTCSVTGTVDSLIKAIARHTVVKIESAQPGLEEVFLAYYNDDSEKEDSGAA